MLRKAAVACVALAALFVSAPAWAAARVALVVGVAHYQAGEALANTVRDAELIAQALRKVGFTVTVVTDPNRQQLQAAMEAMGRQSDGAEAAVIYFAGHGVEVAG